MKKLNIILVIFLLCIKHEAYSKGTLKICMEDSQLYPYIFSDYNHSPKGIQVDIVKDALEKLNIKYKFTMLPWRRCLANIKQGKFHAAIGASYSEARSKYIDYPSGAREAYLTKSKAPKRITQSDFIVVSLRKDNYDFKGDVTTLPSPVYIPKGFAIADELRKAGVRVDQNSKSDSTNFKKLLFRKKGSIVVINPFAQNYIKKNYLSEKLKISTKRVSSKSNFLVFSKKLKVQESRKEEVWNQILKSRKKLIYQLTLKY